MTADFEKRYIEARRKVISLDFTSLNPEQLKAVMSVEGPLLLLAGAGSGKTTVLIQRIANLIRYGTASESTYVPADATEDDIAVMEAGPSAEAKRIAAVDPVEPWRILAITFTNKAAGELKSRLERTVGPEADDIWAQTFHSACVRILRRDADRLGYSKSFTIYDTSDSQNVMKKIIKDFDLDEKLFPYRYVLSIISKAKDEMMNPESFLLEAKKGYDVRKTKVAELYAEYSKRLRDADAMDFDDLLLNTVTLLNENEDVRLFYQRKFRYVLVDEYQDTNNLQYVFASTLAGGYDNLCVVGDDDQSIYKFRGATIKNILSFEEDYKNARVIKLEQNYRSTGHILEAANSVIQNNRQRKGKKLWTAQEGGYKPVLHVSPNESEEAQFVADKILEAFEQGTPWSDNAVLYRMNAQSNQLEYAFKRRGIPYRVFGGMKFFDRAEVKDLLSYLSVIANPADDLRLTRIINVPSRGIGATSINRCAEIATENGTSVFEIVKNASSYPELQRASQRLKQFAILIEDLRIQSEVLPLDELYDLLLEKTGYIQALKDKASVENETKIENVEELKTNIVSYIKDTGDSSLHGFLDEVALYSDTDTLDDSNEGVIMMTIHSAKGLEFPTVFLVGAEEGIFPGIKAIGEPEEMEEERRLCYVAITRAMKHLYISCAQQRMLFGKTSSNRVSRFVEEIAPAHLDRGYVPKGFSFSDRPRGMESNNVHFANKSPIKPVFTPASTKSDNLDFKKGEMVEHRSFGRGMIISMTPMGGDFLVEIAFDNVGAKRLMLKAASKMMKKL